MTYEQLAGIFGIWQNLPYIDYIKSTATQSKVTIFINKELINLAKEFARKKGQSLSEMIESYLKVVVEKEKEPIVEISPDIKKLQGSVKLPADFEYKKMLQTSLNQKYQRWDIFFWTQTF